MHTEFSKRSLLFGNMLKRISHRHKMKKDKISILKDIFCNIEQFDDNKSGYSIAKRAIKELFENTSNKSFNHIYSRLIIIDSLYSTQMGRRYYGLEELAETLLQLNNQYETKCYKENVAMRLILYYLSI